MNQDECLKRGITTYEDKGLKTLNEILFKLENMTDEEFNKLTDEAIELEGKNKYDFHIITDEKIIKRYLKTTKDEL